MHDIVAVFLKIAVRRLFDVLNALEPGRRPLLYPCQELQQVADVGAAFIEVERIEPTLDATSPLGFCGNTVHADDAFDVPTEVVAIELDLEMAQAVVRNPFGEGFRQA